VGAGTAQYAAEPFTLVLKHPAVLRMLLLGRDQLETLQRPLQANGAIIITACVILLIYLSPFISI
jgi:hypothetical protein